MSRGKAGVEAGFDIGLDSTQDGSHGGAGGAVVAAEAAVLAARRYAPLDEIARGGAGRILRARDLAFDRVVALKLPLTPQAGARLRAEAAILARLQHPSIMPVHDTGVFEDGNPFFAMQLVDGRSLRDLIADAPSLDQRLALIPHVVAIAEAMSYAHSQGVIHRDLKPGNVLVGKFGEVLVIDWGLAKLLGAAPATMTATGGDGGPPAAPATMTATGAVIGTPAYMPPEQARGEDADARADVYAIGAILYHVLAGKPPFAGRSATDALEASAKTGPAPIEHLQPRVPVDLAAILSKAMAREPAARYPSARELSADLLRFQTGGLVAARRYSWLARAWRGLRRHRGKVAAGALAAASALVAAAAMPGAAAPPPEARCEASGARAREVWHPARAAALRAGFLATGHASAADTFDRVAQRIERYTGAWSGARADTCRATYARGEQSEALHDLRMACLDRRLVELDAVIGALGQPTAAVLDKAVEAAANLTPLDACADTAALQAVVPPPANPEVRARVDALRADLARARSYEQVGRYADGLAIARTVVGAAGPLGYPPIHAEALAARGALEDKAGEAKAAEATLEEALLAAAEARDDALAARVWADLLYVVGYQLGRTDDALRLRRSAEAAVRRAGHPADPEAQLWRILGILYLRQSKHAEARPLIERALGVFERELGPEHPRFAGALAPLAMALRMQGDYAAARRQFERALAIYERALGPEHPLVGLALSNLGDTLRLLGDLHGASERLEQALAIRERALGPRHLAVATTLHNLAIVERPLRRYDAARRHHERALAIREAALGEQHSDVADTLIGLGVVRQEQGALGEARAHLERALAIYRAALGPEDPQLAYAFTALADLAERQGRHEDARRDYARALELARKGFGPDHPEVAIHLTGLAKALLALGRTSEASAAAERALAIREARAQPAAEVAETRFVLARALWPSAAERGRARELAAQARAALAAAGDAEALAAVDGWLRAR